MKKVLIANRGEIARRIVSTCRHMGIATVAVYSDVDSGAAHVMESDEAYPLGGALARDSYLRVDRLMEAAARSGADAVHPGYGFLSENAEFAEAVTATGLTWIGPSPATIRTMGDKQRARETAMAAGVPVVPGSRRFEPDDLDGLEQAAAEVGFPLLVKAAAGGGGIGMQRIDQERKLRDVVTAVQSAAVKSFGNGAVYLERLIPRARHVEVQVFGLGNGTALHMGERDCSVQRRFQKVIEETPAPGLPEGVRQKMISAALSLSSASRYAGAGTVEFIVDASSFDFYFLEMNTRIQVEHPVTEMVTGIDLVRLQLELASGIPLSQHQKNIVARGASIECRLYAEKPAKMFMPSPGPLNRFRMPQASAHLRIDSGYREGDTISPYYDPMVAKIIVRGANREEARSRMIAALESVEVDGISTNRDFLIACISTEAFAKGDIYTGFVDDHKPQLLPRTVLAT
ncbi:MAG: acetyl-CoA carboxylase biotin carboxylase subunit [Rhizobiales bacterium]|nr:acetyl-CoA carboxylase biotin carboxylase subunit [Hyphomicrobiales bacterium]